VGEVACVIELARMLKSPRERKGTAYGLRMPAGVSKHYMASSKASPCMQAPACKARALRELHVGAQAPQRARVCMCASMCPAGRPPRMQCIESRKRSEFQGMVQHPLHHCTHCTIAPLHHCTIAPLHLLHPLHHCTHCTLEPTQWATLSS